MTNLILRYLFVATHVLLIMSYAKVLSFIARKFSWKTITSIIIGVLLYTMWHILGGTAKLWIKEPDYIRFLFYSLSIGSLILIFEIKKAK